MSEEVKLFGVRSSPFSCRVEIALKMKGVPYAFIAEDLSNKSPLLLKYNPVHKKVPVLLHNGNPVAESVVILEYIDETWKANPILPSHPYERAKARFWSKFIDDKCVPGVTKASWGKAEEREKAAKEVHESLKLLENEVKGKKFFGGDSIGAVDVVASFVGFWIGVIQEAGAPEFFTKEKFPVLWEWKDELLRCSFIKESLPDRETLKAYFRALIDAANAS